MFQQDNTKCHTSEDVKKLMKSYATPVLLEMAFKVTDLKNIGNLCKYLQRMQKLRNIGRIVENV